MGDHEDAVRQEPINAAISEVGTGPDAAVTGVTPAAVPSGDERVDEALARLARLGRTPVAEHVEIFDDVRHRLQDVLASIDQDGPPAPPRP